jgi:alanyl-tRNA synthetase
VDAHEIRRAFLDLLTADGHARLTRAPLVLRDDPTTLFTGSGMQPLLPYLLGAPHPLGTRLTDVQPCLRAQDMDEVGDNRHTTFFEMLGNWSLGGYSKAEQIPRLFGFLVDVVGLVPNRIYVSAFIGDPAHGIPRDEESADVWERLFTERGVTAAASTSTPRNTATRSATRARGSRSTATRTGGAASAAPTRCRSPTTSAAPSSSPRTASRPATRSRAT